MRRLIKRFWYERRNRCPWACSEMHTETGYCLVAQDREQRERYEILREAMKRIRRNKRS